MRTILMLEDEAGIAEMLVLILEREQYTVLAAANGHEALNVLQQTRPDVILTDVMMPGMGGLEFCQLVRADPTLADIPIVFQTSVEEWAVREHFSDFDGFFLKPYDMKTLLARLSVLAKEGRNPGPMGSTPEAEGSAAEEDRPGFTPPPPASAEGGEPA